MEEECNQDGDEEKQTEETMLDEDPDIFRKSRYKKPPHGAKMGSYVEYAQNQASIPDELAEKLKLEPNNNWPSSLLQQTVTSCRAFLEAALIKNNFSKHVC